MVAMVLEFMVVISPLLSFAIGLCIHFKVVNEIGFEELAPMKGIIDSLGGGLLLRLGDEDWVMGVRSMRLCHLFKTFRLACPLMDFSLSKTTSHCIVACSKLSSLEAPIFNFFKVSYSQVFNISSTN